jgi:prepilin-type N-terminal cleavage/methylation domain-containing protein
MKGFSSMSASKASGDQAGFTLIEILIAITLLAFISIGVISVTQNAADTMERTTETNKNNLQIETAMSRFEWDFSQLYSPLYFSTPLNMNPNGDADGDGINDLTGQPVTAAPPNPALQEYYQRLQQRFEQNEHFSGVSKENLPIPRFYAPEKTIFEFFTASNRRKVENTRQSHYAWVRYALGEPIVRNSAAQGVANQVNIPQGLKTLVRYFSADDPYNDKRLEPGSADQIKASVLLENVESLEFQFWDYARRKWENNLRTIQNGESIIRGVKIIITWYDSTGYKRTAERIFRNSWPMVIPNDRVTTGTAATGSAAGGNPAGSSGGSRKETGEETEE